MVSPIFASALTGGTGLSGGSGSALGAGLGGGLLGGIDPWQYIGNLGFGLLANSGPSFQPTGGFAGALGRAGQYANERTDAAFQNELRRMGVLQTAQEMQGVRNIQQYMADHPEIAASNPILSAFLASGSPDALKAVAGAYADPTLPYRMEAAKSDANLKTSALGSAIADNKIAWESASAAEDAVKYLANKPGGKALLNNEAFVSAAAAGQSFIPDNVLRSLLPAGMDPKDIPNMIAAAQTVLKSRATLAAQLASGNQSVVGLETFLTSQGAGALPDVQAEKFRQAKEKAETIARTGGKDWALPSEQQQYVWRGGQSVVQTPPTGLQPPEVASGIAPPPPPPAAPTGSVGYQNGRLVPQPPPVTAPLPATPPAPTAAPSAPSPSLVDTLGGYASAGRDYIGNLFSTPPSTQGGLQPPAVPPAGAQPPAQQGAPEARKVPSLRYAPDGDAMFRGFDEVKRAEQAGWLKGATGIWVNGKHYTWQPE